jgi:hypothetical protein
MKNPSQVAGILIDVRIRYPYIQAKCCATDALFILEQPALCNTKCPQRFCPSHSAQEIETVEYTIHLNLKIYCNEYVEMYYNTVDGQIG